MKIDFKQIGSKNFSYRVWDYLFFSDVENIITNINKHCLLKLKYKRKIQDNKILTLSNLDKRLLRNKYITIEEIDIIKRQLELFDITELKNILFYIENQISKPTIRQIFWKILKEYIPVSILIGIGTWLFNQQKNLNDKLLLFFYLILFLFYSVIIYIIYSDITNSYKKQSISNTLPKILKEVIQEKQLNHS